MAQEEFVVTPWEVSGKVDYDKLVERFGTERVDEALLKRMAKYGELHPTLRRGIFYSHRDMNWILDQYEKGNKFFLYTGRGPSGDVHIGHLLPWILTKYFQDVFKVHLYFQITDDEKFLFKENLSLKETDRLSYENMYDIMAVGLNPELTHFIVDTKCIGAMYPIALEVAKRITFSTVKATFGFDDSYNIGIIFYTSIQSVPCFLPSVKAGKNVPCLIPCGIDQDPHFRLTRDIAPKLGFFKPALLHNKLLPALTGEEKMSSSSPYSAIYMIDDDKLVKKKVMNAFTGGRTSVEEQRKLGANPDVCSVFAYYTYMFEYDDKKLAEIEAKCRSGSLLCGECKLRLFEKIKVFMAAHRERREKAKDIVDKLIMRDRDDRPG